MIPRPSGQHVPRVLAPDLFAWDVRNGMGRAANHTPRTFLRSSRYSEIGAKSASRAGFYCYGTTSTGRIFVPGNARFLAPEITLR